MKIKFRDIRLSKANKERLNIINSIIGEYQEQGYKLTLRQLYYQLVSRDVVPNKQAEYAKLSTLLKEGRMSGVVDWDAIEDRLRSPESPASFSSPEEILRAAANQYQLPRMEGQDNYVEVWVEKDALSGVLSRVTRKYHVPILVNRGYSSVSAMFDSYGRFRDALESGKTITILYLGDYDPSGIDMIRDVRDRILEFLHNCNTVDLYYYWEYARETGAIEEYWKPLKIEWINGMFQVIPIALTREQIDQYNPPPNPAKVKDPRAKDFISKFGSTSWEVDALRPEVLNQILTHAIEELIDIDLYNHVVSKEQRDKDKLISLKQYL